MANATRVQVSDPSSKLNHDATHVRLRVYISATCQDGAFRSEYECQQHVRMGHYVCLQHVRSICVCNMPGCGVQATGDEKGSVSFGVTGGIRLTLKAS